MDKKMYIFFVVADIVLGLINLVLYYVNPRPINMFAAGFCVACGICLGIEWLWVKED